MVINGELSHHVNAGGAAKNDGNSRKSPNNE